MHRSDDVPVGRGRLHGRLLQLLGVVSAVAGLIALWQFGVFGDEPARDLIDAIDGVEAPSVSEAAGETSAANAAQGESASIESPSESSSATSESPSESDLESAPASEEASNPAPPGSTTMPEHVEETADATGCTASLRLTNTWEDMVEVSVEVVNVGDEEIESWEIDLDLDDADIEHFWNMRHLGGDRYGSKDWNGRLDPGEDAVTGFQAQVGHHFDLPGSVPCTARG